MSDIDLAHYAGAKIKALRDRDGYTQDELAAKLQVSKAAVGNYEQGIRVPKQDVLFELAKVFGVSVDTFFPPRDGNEPIPTVQIPVIGEIACGDPITADENIDSYRTEVATNLPTGTLFYLKAKGKSMEPTIKDGTFVLIHEQPEVEDGQIAAVLVDDDSEATLKRVKHQGNLVMLMPDNASFDPIILTKDYPGRIIGRAIRISMDL